MKSAFRSAFFMIMVFIAAVGVAGCAKHPHASEPVAQPAPSAVADPQKIVVAKVNGVELHMDALVNMMNRLVSRESGTSPDAVEKHKKRSLDQLILQELAYQQAKAQGLSIGADKIDMAIKNLKENLGGEKEYADYLAKTHVTEADLRAEVERGLLLETIYNREVLAKVTVPADEVRQEYEKEKHRYIVPEKASIIDVVVLRHDDHNGKASTRKAKELRRKIKADADKNPWNLTLDGTFIVRDITVNKNTERELFEAAAKLKPNEISGVIEAPLGSHIIKLKEYSPERQLTFEEVKSKLELKFKVPAQEKRTQEWEQELKKNAKIEIIDSGN
jgi:parvulin-like peptidyl-prolyl isomerase